MRIGCAVLALVVLGVGLEVAHAAITITIDAPSAGAHRASPVAIAVRVTSTFDVATVRAQVGAVTTALTPATLPTWTGALPVPGLPFGNASVIVTATDVFGASASATVVFVHDEPPTVTILSPQPNTVARPMLHVVATCTDDDLASGCLSFTASVLDQVATGPAIDATLDLSAGDGTAQTLILRARDSSGTTYQFARSIFVEASPALTDVISLGVQVLDVDDHHFLYVDAAGAVRIQRRSDGQDTALGPIVDDGPRPAYGRLTSAGAIYVSMPPAGSGCPGPQEAFEWRGAGAPASLGVICTGDPLAAWTIVGDWGWRLDVAGNPIRRNFATGATTTIGFPADVGGPLFAGRRHVLAANGDLVRVVRDNGDVVFVRDRGGVQSALGRGHLGAQNNPVFDGIAIAFLEPASPNDRVAMVRDGLPPLVLGDPLLPQVPGATYDVAGGWVGFTRASLTSGARQIWRRSPAGVEDNVSPFAADSAIDTMAPDGQLTVINDGQLRYLATGAAGPPQPVGSELGRARFLSDALYVVLGRSVLRFGSGGVPVDAGVPDAAAAIDAGDADAAVVNAGGGGGGGCAAGDAGSGPGALAALGLAAVALTRRWCRRSRSRRRARSA